MGQKKRLQIKKSHSVLNLVLASCAVITLYFNSMLQDPFNSPKFWLLILFAAFFMGFIFQSFQKIKSEQNLQILSVLLILFTLIGFISALNTDLKFTAFMGETQRRNGFFTYFALAIIMMITAIYFEISFVKKATYFAFFTGIALGIYGLMQISGRDFVDWVNPYNAIISTVGNPNFAAAIMAMMAILIFAPTLDSSYNKILRLSSLFLTLILVFTIYLSNARQGLLSFAIGLAVLITIWAYGKNRLLGYFFVVSSAVVSSFAILGMLQVGPLSSLLYKGSVTVRGYYWDAGIAMVRANPFFGVGYDSYGSFFKEYREVGYPLKYGFQITSSNAHNLPIQIFSTQGFIAGLLYLLLLVFIFWLGVCAIKRSAGNERIQIGAVFAAWLAYHAQSIVSIDNIGIAIWGWMLGGALVGLSMNNLGSVQKGSEKISKNSLERLGLLQPLISWIAVISTFALIVVPHYQSERDMLQTRVLSDPSKPENKDAFRVLAFKVLSAKFSDPTNKIMVSSWLVANGFVDEGVNELYKLKEVSPRNLDTLIFLAQLNEQNGIFEKAISLRKEIIKLDPWDASNYLQLGKNYKAVGDFSAMLKMQEKIISFASGTVEGDQAVTELLP